MSEIILHCPMCPPGKSSKLYINVEMGLFNCFRCGFKGSIKKLYKFPDLLAKLEDHLSLAESSRLKSFKPLDLSSHDILSDLNPVREVIYTDPQYAYLESRGWTEDMIHSYRPLVSHSPKYRDRVILPIFDSADKMIYFTARSIDPETTSRYKNADVSRSNILFESKVPEGMLFSDLGIIAEGIFDAAKLPNAVALLGKTLGQDNESHLINLFKKRSSIYVCLDAGTGHNMDTLCASLHSWFPNKAIYRINESAYQDNDLGTLSETLSSVQLVSWIKNNSIRYVAPTLSSKLKNRFACLTA